LLRDSGIYQNSSGKSNGRQTTKSILTPPSFEIAEHTEF
jgi:hypothetical protein